MPQFTNRLEELLSANNNLLDSSPIILAELESGEMRIVDVIEGLRDWLSSGDKERRRDGTQLLAEILQQLPRSYLTTPEIDVLTDFFSDRLADHYTTTPHALLAISSLCCMDNIAEEEGLKIVRSLGANVTCQTLNVSTRHAFYSIFHHIFTKMKKKVLSDFASDFLFGLISGMDGESDPRNLLYLFSFLPNILAEIPLKHLAEETFSVLECYFPVDYSPVEEKDSISREDLGRGLEACLLSSEELGVFCIPLICEKLSSELSLAQMDSLSLLSKGVRVWSIELVSEGLPRLWDGMKGLLIATSDQHLATQAADALISMLGAFSSAVLSKAEAKAFTSFLDNISLSTHGLLSDPSLSLFVPALKLLSRVARVSNITATFIIKMILPQMSGLLESSKSSTDKDIVLRAVDPILSSSVEYDCWEADGCSEKLLNLLRLIVSLINDPVCRASAFHCLSTIASNIPDNYRKELYDYVIRTVADESSQHNREACGRFITSISNKFPDEIEAQLINPFAIREDLELAKMVRTLELLTWIGSAPPLTLSASRLLLSYITHPPNPLFKTSALNLLKDFSSKCGGEVLSVLGRESELPLAVISTFSAQDSNATEADLLAAAPLITNIIRTLDASEQKRIVGAALQLISSRIYDNSSPRLELMLVEALVAGLLPEVLPDLPLDLVATLIDLSTSLELETPRRSAATIIALYLNKSNGDEREKVLDLGRREMEKGGSAERVRLCAWICKALVLRGHLAASDWIDQLLEFTNDPVLGTEGAEAIRLVLEDNPLFSTQNYCNIVLLHKQRVFEKIDKLILNGSKSSKSYSLALAYILKNSPPALVLGKLDKVLDVMVKCIEGDDASICLAILEILSALLRSPDTNIGLLAPTFIPRCLQVATTSPHMVLRQEALKCILLFANFKAVDLIPYKRTVVNNLVTCLNDKKRVVRNCAVKARTSWFLL